MRAERYSVVTGGVRYWPTTNSNTSTVGYGIANLLTEDDFLAVFVAMDTRSVSVRNGRVRIAGVERAIETNVVANYVEPIHAPGPEPGNDAYPTGHIPLDRCWREGCGAQIERDDDVGLCQGCVIELRDM